MAQLEFYFDCSSPWTYLAFDGIQQIAADTGTEITWKPILVGGIFNTINSTVYEQRSNPVPQKLRYYGKDLRDWARRSGLEIGQPPVFPVNSVKAMRGCFVALEQGALPRYARAVFEAYWGELQDISQQEVLEKVVAKAGLQAGFFDRIAEASVKQQLRDTTEELMQRGGFGSPTIFVGGDDMYFGNDRLVLVREALERLA